MSELRDQHKAFAEWFLQQNPIAPNVEDMAWAAWKAALAQPENRPCTCHPGDNPPQPCAQRYALTECKALAQPELEPPRDAWRPASEPPACTRSVLVWLKFGDVETFGKTLGGPSGFAFQNGAITHWRDVTPPTEGAK